MNIEGDVLMCTNLCSSKLCNLLLLRNAILKMNDVVDLRHCIYYVP